jgi:ferrous iron transport protein B
MNEIPLNDKHFEKHRHMHRSFLERELGKVKIVLVGNPNVGKSLIFNELSGLSAEVSNYPGTTVEILRGTYNLYEIYDTPGVYGVSSFNDEECVARDIILAADIILNVVDGNHLERDLFLTQQLIDMGKKIVVLLNFMDEVKLNNISIDIEKLSHFLGIEVIPVVATKKAGFEKIRDAIETAREGIQREELHSSLHSMLKMVGSQAEALLILEGDETIAGRHGVHAGTERDEIYIKRRNRVNYIVNLVMTDTSRVERFSEQLSRIVIRPITGIPIFIATLYISFLFVGVFVAQNVVNFTSVEIGKNHWEPWIRGLFASVTPPGTWVNDILVGEFGIITMTTTYLLFLLLPLVMAFYLILSIMEDSGYLPRLATMVDRSLTKFGLNGRAVIPLILGFGCVTSATMTTRILSSEREKRIATALLQFVVPCSAQLAVISALMAGAGFKALIVYIVTILAVLVVLGTGLNKMLQGKPVPLLLDLPPMRVPRIENVSRKMFLRTFNFMKEAVIWFFVGALAVGIAKNTGFLEVLRGLLNPITVHWLQLPGEVTTAFIMGVVRRDFGAAGLYQIALTPMQITVALIVITLFVPCIASLVIMIKERGLKIGTIIWIGTWIAAFSVGGIVSQIII